jgi:hypothetical protein
MDQANKVARISSHRIQAGIEKHRIENCQQAKVRPPDGAA